MIRYCYTIAVNLIRLFDAIKTMNDMIKKSNDFPEEYVEEYNYGYVRYVIDVMRKTGKIDTKVYGVENLPKDGGYMMYPNHEGKYDVYGLILSKIISKFSIFISCFFLLSLEQKLQFILQILVIST